MSLKDKYAIAGVGITKLARKNPESSTMGFALEGCKRAIEDAGLTKDDIDGLLLVHPSQQGERHGFAGRAADLLGIHSGFTSTVDAGGATPIILVQMAAMAINAGICNNVVCCYGWQNNPIDVPLGLPPGFEFTLPYGEIGATPFLAQIARRHMHDFGTTSQQFGAIAVACRKHANMNPNAQMYGRPMTLEDHQNSRWVVEPLRLFDCCAWTDGGAAVVVTSAERAKNLKHKPVYISGFGQAHGAPLLRPWRRPDVSDWAVWAKAGDTAYKMAKLSPKDIDICQLYDAYTIVFIVQLESGGFCKVGESGPFVEDGRIELGGELPCNTAGGLLSEGHTFGFGHIIEAVQQLRGDCGERQVKDAETAYVTGFGGVVNEYPPTFSCSTMILRR
ncbi:MAG TPA: thiolase family protein [Dehalococcoidia bacterium]|nr:thiolase family protein [Dehalococcoidia bacterium]